MGLMDKVKAQVDSLAQQANAGMAKLDNMPVQRKSDALLRSLGIAVLAERTGRGNPETSAEIERLISEITTHEAQSGINIVQQAAQAAAQAQARGQMGQPGPGAYIASSPSATNPNVGGTMPGPGAGYGGYGTPSGPSFGQTGPGPGPGPGGPGPGADQPPAQSFPPAAGSTAFPQSVPATQFPPADAPAGFPAATPAQDPVGEPASDQDQPHFPA